MVIKKVSEIKPDKDQPRKTFDEEKLQFLAESILSNGLLKPIIIDENNMILDGERRWRAHKLAKIKKIECQYIVGEISKEKRFEEQLIFNLARSSLNKDDERKGILKYYQQQKRSFPDITIKKIANKLGTLAQKVQDIIWIEEKAPIKIKSAVDKGEITYSAGVELAKADEEDYEELIEDAKEVAVTTGEDSLRERIKEKKELKEVKKKLEQIKKEKKWETKVTTTQEVLSDIRDDIFETNNQLNRMMFNMRRMRKTKFYLYKAKDKDAFFKVVDGAIQRVDKWSKELQQFKDDFQLEIVKE